MIPISSHSFSGDVKPVKTTDEEIEHRKLVYGKDIRVGLEKYSNPDVCDRCLEVIFKLRIEFSLRVASDIDS